EREDGLCSVQAPAGAGDVHAVLHEVAAGALDDAGGDGPTRGQCGGVIKVFLLVEQVGRGGVGAPALLGGQSSAGGGAADRGGDQTGVAGQHFPGFDGNPLFHL